MAPVFSKSFGGKIQKFQTDGNDMEKLKKTAHVSVRIFSQFLAGKFDKFEQHTTNEKNYVHRPPSSIPLHPFILTRQLTPAALVMARSIPSVTIPFPLANFPHHPPGYLPFSLWRTENALQWGQPKTPYPKTLWYRFERCTNDHPQTFYNNPESRLTTSPPSMPS